MKKNYRLIIQDGAVLVALSTVFVVVLSTGFKMVKKDVKMDPIVLAVNQDNMESGREIVAKEPGAERLNLKDEFGRTPLMMASYANYKDPKQRNEKDTGRVAWIEFLAKSGADLNAADKDGWTPLMYASWSGFNSVVAKLLELGAQVNLVDRQGNTALVLAAQRGYGGIVKQLADKGADKSLVTLKGKKALDMAQDGLKQYPDLGDGYNQAIRVLQGS